MVIHQTEEFSSNGLETLTSQSVWEYQTTNHLGISNNQSFGNIRQPTNQCGNINQPFRVETPTNHIRWEHQITNQCGNINQPYRVETLTNHIG